MLTRAGVAGSESRRCVVDWDIYRTCFVESEKDWAEKQGGCKCADQNRDLLIARSRAD